MPTDDHRLHCLRLLDLPLHFVRYPLMLCLVSCANLGYANDVSPKQTAESQLMEELISLREENNVAAMGLVIIKDNKVSLLEVRGLASREPSVPIKADAIFRIGSISKMFAGLTAATLDRRGVLSLNAPIRSQATQGTYSNPWQGSNPIMVAQLLEHSAGFESISKAEWDFSDPLQPPLSKTLRLYPESREAKWPPGLHYSYSNAGAGLAGYVMEQATQEPWEDLLKKVVLDPLGMSDTTVFKPTHTRLARGYDTDGSTRIPYWHQIFRPFAAINSSLSDMSRFIKMLINKGELDGEKLFPAAVVERIETPRTTLAARKGLGHGYGLGNYHWLREGIVFHGHGGDADGYLSKLGYTRHNNSGYFLVITAFQNSTLAAMQRRVEKYLVRNLRAAQTPETAALTPQGITLITGDYHRVTERFPRAGGLAAAPPMRIFSREGSLYSQEQGERSELLIPVTAELFRRKGENRATLFIGRGDDGHVYFQEGSDNFRKLRAPKVLR